ncbi:ribonuclease H-like domain-containing protein [Tanacetum coccineum]
MPAWNMDTGASSHLTDNTVRQFTHDNDVSVEFDAYDFSVKDYQTRWLLLRCDSTGDLYPVTQQPSSQTPIVLLSFSSTTWHRRPGHLGDDVLRRLSKHAKLPFYNFESSVDSVFEIIHSDIWTSPIPSESGIKYYAIFLDHFSHFVWVYPLHKKSDLFDNFVAFRAYVNKQFNVDIKALQCDHGGEYDNTRFHDLFCQNGIQFRFSCPRTSQQNGKSERMLRTINNLIRTLLFQAHIPPSYWVEALNMVAHLLNILPSTAINNEIPFTKLYNQTPTYEHLRVFGEILERAHMQNCNPCRTPVDTESKLGSDGDPVSDPTLYRSLAGALQYLTFTRPDLSYAVQQVCLYMHDPRDPHFTALKRILRYVRGTLDYGLQLHVSSTTQLSAYTDADWAGCPVTRRSTSGYCVFLGDNLLSWSAKRQVTLSRSSAEAEYRGVANVVAETVWIRNLLCELHTPLFIATLVYCDNVSVVYMSANPVQHQRTKHIEIDNHFVRDFVASGQVRVLHVLLRFQYADIFTKGLPTTLFIEFRSSLNVRRSPAHTEGEY